jgi:integrase
MNKQIEKIVEGFEDLNRLKIFENRLEKRNELVFCIWKVSLNLALRISDTLNITTEDAKKYLKKGYYLSKDIKTKKSNRVKLNENTKIAFERALTLKLEGQNNHNIYLFSGIGNRSKNSDKPISRQQVFRVYQEVAEWENLDIKIGTHSARKTWGLQVYKATKDLSKVMHRLNHSSEAITLKYIGITQQKMDDLVEEFNL